MNRYPFLRNTLSVAVGVLLATSAKSLSRDATNAPQAQPVAVANPEEGGRERREKEKLAEKHGRKVP